MKKNLANFLTNSANKFPNKKAITFESTTVTYKELDILVNKLASGLYRTGLRAEDRVILMLPSSLNWVLFYYALAKIGAIVIPVNPLYRRGELEYIINDSRAKAFIGHSDYLDEAKYAFEKSNIIRYKIVSGQCTDPDFINMDNLFDYINSFDTYDAEEDDPFAIIYTSGTTGKPKGAILTHSSLMNDAIAVSNVRKYYPNDVVLSVLPLFHIYGQTHALNISIYLGLSIRMWERFDASGVLKAIEEEESTILYAVPTMINRLIELANERPPKKSSLRFCISGGASLPVEVLHRFENIFHTTIYESYGLTEFSPTCIENPFGKKTKPGSIGLPIPPFKVRIVDESDNDVLIGEIGELIVSGNAMMKGYLNQPEATAETLRGGWLHTGDLARMDEEGYIYIVDRKKDMIIRGGYNVYPREIEEVLYTHPDILEAAVFGIPNDDLGEEVAAAVVVKPNSELTPEDIIKYVKQRVAPYKYPRVVKIMDELPKTAAGKIYKRGIKLNSK